MEHFPRILLSPITQAKIMHIGLEQPLSILAGNGKCKYRVGVTN